jgi:hypothetical protein
MKVFATLASSIFLISTSATAEPNAAEMPGPDQMRQMMADRAAADKVPESRGTGPYPAIISLDDALLNHVIYRPEDLTALGSKKLGIVIWGNGGCTDDGASARHHLEEVASHGYLVIAPGRILSGPSRKPNAPAPNFMTTTGRDMLAGLDWALAENKRRGSQFFGRIDLKAVAFSGHSCGGILSLQISDDTRVKTVIIHNSGIFPNIPQRPQLITDKAWLDTRLHTPILYIIGNSDDVGHPMAMDDFARITKVPVFVAERDTGHEGTFAQPNGGINSQIAVQWLEWKLRDNRQAARMFVGANCGLCVDPTVIVRRKGF